MAPTAWALADFLDRAFHAEDVADGGKGDDFRLVVDLGQVFFGEVAFFVEVHVIEFSPGLLADALPRDQVGMMFRNGNDDLIALLQARFCIAAGYEVQRFCRIADEDDFFRRSGIDEFTDCFAGFVVQFTGFDAEDVGAAMGITVVMFQEVYDGMDDLVRFLRRRSIIKVNDLMSIMDFSQDGEIFAYI